MQIDLSKDAYEDWEYWRQNDPKKAERLKRLIQDIIDNGVSKGLGKPEPLKGNRQSYWSRRIDRENRLVYRVRNGRLEIVQCKTHYREG